MRTTRIMALAALLVGGGLALHAARAQQPGIRRTDLQRHDLGVPRREVVQVHTWTQKTSTTTRKSTSTSRRDGVYFGDCKPNNLVGGASIKRLV